MFINFPLIKQVTNNSFFDTGTIDVFTSGSTALGDITKTYSSGSVISMGVKNNSGNRIFNPDGINKITYDVDIRVSLDTAVSENDHVTVKTKSGNAVNETYQVLVKQIGVGCIILKCNRVEV